MRYPHFAAEIKRLGTPAEIMERFGFSRRQVFEYLAGRSLPRAEKILPYPELVAAAQRDLRVDAPEPLAA
jgi:hypothetical protein